MQKVIKFLICFLLVFTLVSCKSKIKLDDPIDEQIYKVVVDYKNGDEKATLYTPGNLELKDPTYEGYTFVGWYVSEDTRLTLPITKDVEIFAKWSKNAVTSNITYNTNGGTLSDDAPTTYVEGVGLTLPTPTKEGCSFVGWYKDEALSDGPYTEINTEETGNVSLYAEWKTATLTKSITYVTDGGTVPSSAPTSYVPGQTAQLVPATKEGYIFRGWFNNPEFSGNIVKVINAGQKTDLTFYAKFVENKPENLNVSILGDSISTYLGYIPSSYPAAYAAGDVTSVDKTWWYQTINALGMNYCANASYSGGYVYGTDVTSGSNAERIKALASKTLGNPDVVIIHMGVNDATNKQEKAEIFKASYLQMINEIKSQYPGVKIFVCTMIAFDSGSPTATTLYNDYVQSIIDIASETDCELIELHKVINFTNLSTYMMDAKHPNAAGMKAMADEVVEVISKYYKLK